MLRAFYAAHPKEFTWREPTVNAAGRIKAITKVEVVTPEDYSGDVIGDLNRRRGHIQGMEDGPSGKVVTAEVPLAEMFGYATSVRSMSQGRATFTMEFAKYQEVPNNVAEAVMKKAS